MITTLATVVGAARILGLLLVGVVAGLIPAMLLASATGLTGQPRRRVHAPAPPWAAPLAPPPPAPPPGLPDAEPLAPRTEAPALRAVDPALDRYRDLYDTEYAEQLHRLDTLRVQIRTQMTAGSAAEQANGHRVVPWDEWPPEAGEP